MSAVCEMERIIINNNKMVGLPLEEEQQEEDEMQNASNTPRNSIDKIYSTIEKKKGFFFF